LLVRPGAERKQVSRRTPSRAGRGPLAAKKALMRRVSLTRSPVTTGGLAAATVLCLSAYYILTGAAARELGPLTVATLQRLLAGALLMLPRLLPLERPAKRSARLPLTPAQQGWLLVLSITNVPVIGCLVAGFAYSTPTNAALIGRLDLPVALLVGHWFLQEKAHRIDWLLLLPLIAAALMVLEVSPRHWQPHWLGDLMFLGHTVLAVANGVLIRRYLGCVSPWTITRWNVGLSGLWLLILTLALDGHAGLLRAISSTRALAVIAVSSLLASIELTAYYALLRRLGIWYVRCILLLVPIATLGAEILRGKVDLHATQGAGTALLLVILLLLALQHARRGCAIQKRHSPGPARK